MKNNTKYKLKFNDFEINLFHSYELENRRRKLMSLYSYLLKISEFGATKISFSSLLKRYNNSHKKNKMALTTLKDAIKSLIDLGLLKIIDKSLRSVNIYSFVRFNFKYFYEDSPTKIRLENPTCGKVDTTTKDTKFSTCTACPKFKRINIDKDIDVKDNSSKSYEEFIKSQEKVKDLKAVIKRAKELLKFTKTTNAVVRETVINNITKYFKGITKIFLDQYILTTIAKAKSDFKSYKAKVSIKKKDMRAKRLGFNNCEQRNYNYEIFESVLLGEKNYEDFKDELINKNNPIIEPENTSNTLKFNNIDQRTYDYDSLEKRLLGWE